MPQTIYHWAATKNLADLHLEGSGELSITPDGELLIRTHRLGPSLKATNVWFRHLILPENFRAAWRYRSESPAGNTMIIFNALPILLPDLFADPRSGAEYSDLAGCSKIAAHTCGFHRAVFNNQSVLRKIGGKTPAHWGDLAWPSDAWKQCDQTTRLATTTEPLTPLDKGQWHNFSLTRQANHIQFTVNGKIVHDIADAGEYPYHQAPLLHGHLGFRNFGGPADDFYADVRIESLE